MGKEDAEIEKLQTLLALRKAVEDGFSMSDEDRDTEIEKLRTLLELRREAE